MGSCYELATVQRLVLFGGHVIDVVCMQLLCHLRD